MDAKMKVEADELLENLAALLDLNKGVKPKQRCQE